MKMLIPLILSLLSAQSGDEKNTKTPPTPSVSVTVETPAAPQFRKVSPEEVQAAYERLLSKGNPPSTQPAPTPSATLESSVPIIPLEFRQKSNIEIAKPLERVKPDAQGPPEWKIKWTEKKMATGQGAVVVLDYQWKNLVCAVELKATNAKSSIRVLLDKPMAEQLVAEAGLPYDLIISCRAPGEMFWRTLYRADGQIFRPGYSHKLEFPAAMSTPLAEYLRKEVEAQAKILDGPPAVEANIPINIPPSPADGR
jgi:hypothetical protein